MNNLTLQEEAELRGQEQSKPRVYSNQNRNEYMRNYMKQRRKNNPELKQKHTQYCRIWRSRR